MSFLQGHLTTGIFAYDPHPPISEQIHLSIPFEHDTFTINFQKLMLACVRLNMFL